MNTPPQSTGRIELVVFDWAGTTVDYGSVAPVLAFQEAFRVSGVDVSVAEVRGPMGVHKKDHIRDLFGLESVAVQWKAAHGEDWTEEDVQQLYETFMPVQVEKAQALSDVIPGTLECCDWLRQQGVAIGASTGYPQVVARPIIEAAAGQGYRPDANVCTDEVPAGRPAPWMIYRNMEQLGVFPAAAVLKVGDTVPDIEAGLNAGVRTVGVTQTGSEVGLTAEEFEELADDEAEKRVQAAARVLGDAGAHHVIRSLAELPELIQSLG